MAGALSVYAYPWDVIGDAQALDTLTSLNADRVVLAAAYHSVRAATPRHPLHKIVNARWSAIYAPFRPEAFAGKAIAPRRAGDWVDEGSFARSRRSIADAGIGVAGWLALTHVDAETASDEFQVVNAFGDVYGYALCPSHDAVVEYSMSVVREIVDLSELSTVVVEAWGQLGVMHASEHDKTSAAGWTQPDLDLLSICFCSPCGMTYRTLGADVTLMRAAVGAAVGTDHAASVRAEWAGVVLAARSSCRHRMVSAILGAAHEGGATEVELHGDDDLWATGPSSPVTREDDVSSVIAPAWRAGAESIERIRRLRRSHSTVDAYVSVLGAEPVDELASFWHALLSAGARSLHLYHFGLASARRMAAAQAALGVLQEGTR